MKWEGEKERTAPGAKRGKHTQPERGTRTTSDFHSAEPVRQRGQSTEARKSQAQGGGCRLGQPPLLRRHRPGDTFHHLLSEKRQSSQAEWFLPGNRDCVATETTTSREERLGLARRAPGAKPVSGQQRPGGRQERPVQDGTPGVRGEERGRRGQAGKR